MTIPEAGERLGMKAKAAYKAAARGMFPVVHNGRHKYVRVREFENWLSGVGTNPTWPQPPVSDGATGQPSTQPQMRDAGELRSPASAQQP
jgi:hypothetical protein